MRKALSFVLVLALVLGSFSFAFAADTKVAGLSDIAGHANEDAIVVNNDLSIINGYEDGTFKPDQAVTRAEFAAMLTRALAIPESALAGYTSTSFKDTAGYSWAVSYLGFAQSKGIMLGDGAGNAMPGRTITVNEAVTMALRAIGYTQNSALLVGSWPSNYVSIAQNEELYDKVSSEATVTRGSAAQIIYNLLTVQKVAVNADGATEFLTTGKEKDPANLLNTNLGATEKEKEILGVNYDYDNTLINITGKIGAYGTAYVNDDGDLIAFHVKSTALTGKIDGVKFKVGDTKYDLPSNSGDLATTATVSAIFANADRVGTTSNGAMDTIITNVKTDYNDGSTLTINADVSGKNIKEVYSIVAWHAAPADLADSDVQDEITDDQQLLGEDFALDDDDNIDLTQFQLTGVASLDKIEKDNVVYVYTDGDVIRKVAVGTETVEGTVDETTLTKDTVDTLDTVTIGDKTYSISPVATSAAKAVDVDSEGIFYLDASGKIFDFDGTNTVDNYAIVKASKAGDSFNNLQVKLYTSEDSTKTYYLSEDNATKIDWTTKAGQTVDKTTTNALGVGTLLGYSLDSDGQIDGLNVTSEMIASGDAIFAPKLLKGGSAGTGLTINSDAVVFTYDTTTDSGLDVCTLKDVDAGKLTGEVYYILDEGKVAALFIEQDNADVDQDAIYGVFNKASNAKDSDDKAIYRFTGFIDGAAFNYKTNDDSNDANGANDQSYGTIAKNIAAGKANFGVYKITLDASDLIKKVEVLEKQTTWGSVSGSLTNTNSAATLSKLEQDNTVMTTDQGKFSVDDEAVVYKYSTSDKVFTVSKLSAIDNNDTVALYDTKGDDSDGIANVVIFIDN
jgi:hypothetical protein